MHSKTTVRTLFSTNFLQNISMSVIFFTKTIFHIPSVWLIGRAAPSIFLAHGLPHGSGQLFLFSLLVVVPQKCFYSCDGKHTLISFPTELRKRQKGIQSVLPSQQKENVHSIKLHLWVAGESWILRRHESVGMFSVHKRWRQATEFSSLMLIPKQTVKCTLWFSAVHCLTLLFKS